LVIYVSGDLSVHLSGCGDESGCAPRDSAVFFKCWNPYWKV
jgi:hypothetical protein